MDCLVRGESFEESDAGQHPLEFKAISGRAGFETQYIMELFAVHLIGEKSHLVLAADPRTRWLREADVQAEQTRDGRRVSVTMATLLNDRLHQALSHDDPI